jgi:hypothetical protein
VRNRAELRVLWHQFLTVEPDVGRAVSGEIAVVGGTEDGNALAIMGRLVALLLHLVRTD